MYIIVPMIIITIIVAFSFGASNLRNINAHSNFLDLNLSLPSLRGQQANQQNNTPPVLQEPQIE